MKILTVALRKQKVSPKKARLVMAFINQKSAEQALHMLENSPQKTAKLALNLLKSALDAAQKKDLKPEELYLSESIVQEGRRMKRFYIRARGRSTVYHKRTAHLKMSLSKIEDKIKTKSKKGKTVKSESKNINKKEVSK